MSIHGLDRPYSLCQNHTGSTSCRHACGRHRFGGVRQEPEEAPRLRLLCSSTLLQRTRGQWGMNTVVVTNGIPTHRILTLLFSNTRVPVCGVSSGLNRVAQQIGSFKERLPGA